MTRLSKTSFIVVAFCTFAAVGFCCEKDGGSGGGGQGSGGKTQHGFNPSRSKSGSSRSGAAAAQYKAFKQAGYYRDAKTGAWYYQPDASKAAVKVAAPVIAKANR